MAAVQETVDRVRSIDVDAYKYGFISAIESDVAPKGLNEDIVRFISAKKEEPEWLLAWRLDAYRRWLTMDEPKWARVDYPPIDFQDIHYFAAPKTAAGPKSLDEVDPELLRTYAKLGIPLVEQEILAGESPARPGESRASRKCAAAPGRPRQATSARPRSLARQNSECPESRWADNRRAPISARPS